MALHGPDTASILIGYAQDGVGGNVYLLGEERIIAVGVEDGPFEELTREELKDLFAGEGDAEAAGVFGG